MERGGRGEVRVSSLSAGPADTPERGFFNKCSKLRSAQRLLWMVVGGSSTPDANFTTKTPKVSACFCFLFLSWVHLRTLRSVTQPVNTSRVTGSGLVGAVAACYGQQKTTQDT